MQLRIARRTRVCSECMEKCGALGLSLIVLHHPLECLSRAELTFYAAINARAQRKFSTEMIKSNVVRVFSF